MHSGVGPGHGHALLFTDWGRKVRDIACRETMRNQALGWCMGIAEGC